MSTYLKNESFYSDLYDLWTVEECLRRINSWHSEVHETSDLGILSESQSEKVVNFALKFTLYLIKGGRFKNKAAIVQGLIENDRKKEDVFQNVQSPQNVRCAHCSGNMKVIQKDLYELSSNPLRVLFFFECLVCNKRKGVFDNGEVYKSKPELCPKCHNEIKVFHSKKRKTFVWIKSCLSCDFKETEIDDFEKTKKDRAEKEQMDRVLLEKHRSEFCLSSKEGEEFLEGLRNMEALRSFVDKAKQKETDPDYKEAELLKRVSVFQLEQMLSEELARAQYVKLSFEKPEIDKYVIVPFTVQDGDTSRKEYDSVHKLQRIFKKAARSTNWRLMSEGISYRLGYLSGRIKGYEREEDLVELIKREKGKKNHGAQRK